MVEIKYLRLEENDALEVKKHIVGSELNLLLMIKKLNNYRILRKKEFEYKRKLKSLISELKKELKNLLLLLPKQESKEEKKEEKKESSVISKRKRQIDKELEEIREKLEKLQALSSR